MRVLYITSIMWYSTKHMYYKVKVFADAGQDAVVDDGGARITIYTRRPPKENAANEDVLRLLGMIAVLARLPFPVATAHEVGVGLVDLVAPVDLGEGLDLLEDAGSPGKGLAHHLVAALHRSE